MAALFRGDLIELIVVVGIMIVIGVGKALAKKSADQKEADKTRHKDAIRPSSKAKKSMASTLDDFMAQISSGPVNKPEQKTVTPAPPPPAARKTQPTPAADPVRVQPAAVALRTPSPVRPKRQVAVAIPVAAKVATPGPTPAGTAATPKRKRRKKIVARTKSTSSPPEKVKVPVRRGFYSNIDVHQLGQAVVMAEVLGKPRGMSPYSGPPACS